jgi:hypothetical protein
MALELGLQPRVGLVRVEIAPASHAHRLWQSETFIQEPSVNGPRAYPCPFGKFIERRQSHISTSRMARERNCFDTPRAGRVWQFAFAP